MDGRNRQGSRVPAQRGGGPMAREQAAQAGRTRGVRGGMLLGVLAIESIGMGLAISGFLPASATRATGADFWGPFGRAVGLAALCVLGVHLVAFALLAPVVSYRWYDTFFLLVPVVSVVFWFRVVWRVTALPERYWPPRDDEVPGPPRRQASGAGWTDARTSH